MCSRCTQLEAQVARLRVDVGNVEEERRTAARKFSDLKAELNNPETGGTATDEEKRLHALWQDLCHHGGASLGPKRLPALRKALRADWGGAEKIEQAIRGVAKFPFVTKQGRAARGTARQRHDDLELICRNEVNLEKFGRLSERVPEPAPQIHAVPEHSLREIYLRSPGALDEGNFISAYCMNCAYQRRTGASTLKGDTLHCNMGCTHEQQERALREWWAESGLASCPTCGGEGPKLRHALMRRAAA